MLISFPSSPGCEGSREGACGWSHWLIGSIGLFSIYFMTQTKFKGSCDAHRPWRSPHGMKKYCGKSISNHHVLSPPEDQDPPRGNPSRLSDVCAPRKDANSEWLARDKPERNPMTINPETVRFSPFLSPSCPPTCSPQLCFLVESLFQVLYLS